MNPITSHGGDLFMNLGAGFLTGAIVAEAFADRILNPAYGWLSIVGLSLLGIGYMLKFVREDWTL